MQMEMRALIGACLGLSLLLAGCDRSQEAVPPAGQPDEQAAAPHAPAEVEIVSLGGKVLEVAQSQEFTYLRVATPEGEKWVAVPTTEVQVGEQISVSAGELLHNFPSKTLNRTFTELVVTKNLDNRPAGGPAMHGGAAAPAPAPQKPGADSFAAALQAENTGRPGPIPGLIEDAGSDAGATVGSSKAIVPLVEIKVDKAPGKNGYRVGELFEQAAKLDGQQVRVRGQVVKISMNIMGRNWLHLQDGTGNTMKNTHDLVVTTMATPAKGEVVLVEGKLAANRDFGAGYHYPVIIEEASVSK